MLMSPTLTTFLAFTNASRVLLDLHELRKFGATGAGLHSFGVSRRALTDADLEARQWVAKRMEAAGLNSQIDGLGTVYGSAGPENVPALLMGSHTDTQPEGGWLDGALGVAYALEAARVLNEGGASDEAAWSVVDWQDEGGRFGTLTASSLFVGHSRMTPELWEARRAAGVAGIPVMHASGRHGGWAGYLEAHIEQGPRLERANATLGVVSSIVGLRQLRIACSGEQNHAGTTAMPDRRDAALEAMRLATALDNGLRNLCEAWEEGGCSAVWTFSELSGFVSASTVTGAANLTLQYRAPQEELLQRMQRLITSIVATAASTADSRTAASCVVHANERAPVVASQFDAGLVKCFHDAAVATVGESQVMRLHSAALHDAAPIAEVMPAAMLFVPSVGGISHSFDEHTSDADIAAGVKAYVRAAVSIALGDCQSQSGPTCVPPDARKAWLFSELNRRMELEDEGLLDDAMGSEGINEGAIEDEYPDL